MIIQSSSVSMASYSRSLTETSQQLKVETAAARRPAPSTPQVENSTDDSNEATNGDLRHDRIWQLLKAFFGHNEESKASFDKAEAAQGKPETHRSTNGQSGAIGGPGMSVQYSQAMRISEETAMQAQGSVTLADGRSVTVNMQLSLSRIQTFSSSVTVQSGPKTQDPLVINYAASSVSLSASTFDFDLDSNGQTKSIHVPSNGSGFLALDSNTNGKIDNGNELFGTQSGNGFADLAALDSDGNQWIDEADTAWDALRIWSPADNGGKMQTLASAGIGAIYLGHASTDISLGNGPGNTSGQLRQSGLFLYENGGAGTVQHVDLVV
ncbi:hypothetical protein KSF73_11090 [Burkholderiaceae bacterium DAT-1]|nr:hypothetical protein [Burkholderiaceae bacterium DAT-1]